MILPTSAPRSALTLVGWAQRTDVQRMELYTWWSLRIVSWVLLGSGAFAALSSVESTAEFVGVACVAVALAVVTDRCLAACVDLSLQSGPAPVRLLGALVVLLVPAGIWASFRFTDGAFGVSYFLATSAAWALGGAPERRFLWVPVLYGAAVMGLPVLSISMALSGAAIAGFFVFTVQSSLWVLRVVHELDGARRVQADLAVAEERLRFSRDVHDVMGRHLSTIAVQAELAATLAERGDERAVEVARTVRSSAHEALREARALARGYRPLDLAQEVEGAVSLLASAGIDTRADLESLDPRWAEPVARAVREGVTNVLRHSRATRVTISHHDGVVELRNDGLSQPCAPGADGSGLTTLTADLAAHGVGTTHMQEGDEFVLRLVLDAPARSMEAS